MAWSGGTFSRTNGANSGSTTWALDRDAGSKITAALHDAHDQDLATGINSCIEKGGSNAPTANLPMGGFKHSNVGSATARTEYGTAAQIQDGSLTYGGTAGGTTTAMTLTLSPAITAYVTGMRLVFKMGASANGASATLNVNGVAAAALVAPTGTALDAGVLTASSFVEVIYTGSQWLVMSALATSWQTWSITYSASSGTGITRYARYCLDAAGKKCTYAFSADLNTLSGLTGISLPVSVKNVTYPVMVGSCNSPYYGVGYLINSGGGTSASINVQDGNSFAAGTISASGGDIISGFGTYEVA